MGPCLCQGSVRGDGMDVFGMVRLMVGGGMDFECVCFLLTRG